MLLPQARYYRGLSWIKSTSRSLSHPSRSWVPHTAGVAIVRENVLRMVDFTLDHPAKYSNKNTKTHGTD